MLSYYTPLSQILSVTLLNFQDLYQLFLAFHKAEINHLIFVCLFFFFVINSQGLCIHIHPGKRS